MVILCIFFNLMIAFGVVIGCITHWEDGIRKTILYSFIGIMIMTDIISMVYFGAESEFEKDKILYNNGICSECGGEYHLVMASNSYSNRNYIYECSECLHAVELNNRMK